MRQRLHKLLPLLAFAGLLAPLAALARIGGGEHYSSGSHSFSGGSSGGGGDLNDLLYLVYLTVRYPKVMIPTIVVCGGFYLFYHWGVNPNRTTQRALRRRDAELRTTVTVRDVDGWVTALRYKDPSFDRAAFLEKVKELFGKMQEAWFLRDLEPVRRFMSDATFQRLRIQLGLLRAQGIRDAIADVEVMDLQIIGLDQSQWFDTLQVRIKARMRDTDVPAQLSDDEARARARRQAPEAFIEVWSFVRKPGATTRIGQDLYQGKCPNCGAPFDGGATNSCPYCNAVVNSGNYDWVLAEITQGEEAVRGYDMVDGLLQARELDPALNLEMLEDRASLVFWRWIEAQSEGEPKKLAKLATGNFVTLLEQDLVALQQKERRKVFLECAVGGVITRLLRNEAGRQEAHVEVRWSARMGVGPVGGALPRLPTVPQRWMFVLTRDGQAKTQTDSGMATNRCPNCHAPLTDTLSASCDYCGQLLGNGQADWVLLHALPYETWDSVEAQRYHRVVAGERAAREAEAGPAVFGAAAGAVAARSAAGGGRRDGVIADVRERERLLYMMAAVAAADGQVDAAEKRLLRMCATRWNVAWGNVELAISSGEQLFEKLVPKGSPEAESILAAIVQVALADGKVDRKERRMIESAAEHLGIPERLSALLGGR